MGIFGLRGIVNRYNHTGSKVYACFLDASKAFDNVKHEKLCLKLLKRNVPASVVKLFFILVQNSDFLGFMGWGIFSRILCQQISKTKGGFKSLFI